MIQLEVEHIANRAVEVGWTDNNEELLALIDTLIEDEVTVQYGQKSDRLGDMEELFEYTSKIRKQVQAKAIQLKEEAEKLKEVD